MEKTIERNIPSMKNPLLFFMKEPSEEGYVDAMVEMEKRIEKELIDILGKMGIQSSVKTDRYSLPYSHEIKCVKVGTSYLNSAFDTKELFRKIAEELLSKDATKIRFFMHIEIADIIMMGSVRYRFCYYNHR